MPMPVRGRIKNAPRVLAAYLVSSNHPRPPRGAALTPTILVVYDMFAKDLICVEEENARRRETFIH